MKKIILGIVAALVLVCLIYFGYSFVSGFFGNSGGPVSPEMLKPGVSDYGSLKVTVLGQNGPLSGVEVDLGTVSNTGPAGPFTYARTAGNGVALFEKLPVGTYDIFWNSYFFPKGYDQSQRTSVQILKGQTTEKTIQLQLEQ